VRGLVKGKNLWVLAAAVAVFFAVLAHPATSVAANPGTINFQGKVVNADGTNVTDGNYKFVFALYSVSSGGTALWTETQTTVAVTSGVFQVALGSANPLTSVDFNANPSLYLGITFNNDVNGEMSPRPQLQSVPFAFNSDKVGGLTSSQLVQLAPSTVQTFSSANSAIFLNNTGAGNLLQLQSTTDKFVVSNGGNVTAAGALTVQGTAGSSIAGQLTLSGTNANELAVTGAPNAVATSSLVQLGSAIAGGNAVTNGGTYFGINTPASGAGSAADPLNVQIAGKSYLKIANDGSIHGQGFDIFDPTDQGGATTNIGNYTAGGNFGQAVSANAFINNLESYSSDFIFSLASATTNNRNIGDSTNWYFNNAAAINGQVTSQDISARGGVLRMTTATTSGRGGLIAEGGTAGTLDKSLNPANLPIIQMKVSMSVARATDDFYWGMGDTATAPTANDALPTNAVYFWSNNSTGTTGWQGVVRIGNTQIGAVNCPGTITAGQFATGRIIVVSYNTTTNAAVIRFMIDNDASDGINFLDCGTVSGTMAQTDMALEAYVIHTTNTASTFDVDYARFWQDDAPTSATDAASTVQTEQMMADISTGQDDQTSQAAVPTDPASEGITPDTPAQLTDSTQKSSDQPSSNTGLTNDNSSQSNTVSATASAPPTVSDAPADALNLSSASISGGLTVGGDLNVGGLSVFQKLATFIGKTVFRQDVEFDGHITVAADSAGYATLKATESKVHVAFKNPYETAPVVSANTVDGQFLQAAVSNITKDGFDITVATPVTQDTKFSWTAVAVMDPQTAENPVATSP